MPICKPAIIPMFVLVFGGQFEGHTIVIKYDSKTLMPLLVIAFQFLNLNIDGLIKPTTIDDNENSIFG
jgi:hypothetical protein